MSKSNFGDWVEPAHPVLVQRFQYLVNIYRFIKAEFQDKVDKTFDRVSQQIGFVVTTTLPLAIDIADGARIDCVTHAAKNLKGTIFEKEFAQLMKDIKDKSCKNFGDVAIGNYTLYLLWYDALKLKLKADWIEPAHFRNVQAASVQKVSTEEAYQILGPGIREPAHWFDAGIALAQEEEIHIAAIDEVYTDLRLADRIAAARRKNLKYSPGIREPAHFRQILEQEDFVRVLTELAGLLKKYGL